MPRALCFQCRFPQVVCLCQELPERPIDSSVPVIIIQHPLEAKRTQRTDSLLLKCINNIKVIKSRKIPDEISENTTNHIINDSSDQKAFVVLLYPCSDSVSLTEFLKTRSVRRLLVLDGTWQLTKEMYKASSSLCCVHLDLLPSYQGAFVIRKPPQKGWISTAEAVASALDFIELGNVGPKVAVVNRVLAAYSAQQLRFTARVKHNSEKRGYMPHLYDDLVQTTLNGSSHLTEVQPDHVDHIEI
jgi:DTW domain-containing protein YfiP